MPRALQATPSEHAQKHRTSLDHHPGHLVPASQATAAGPELLFEEHYSADGYQVDHYVTRDGDGVLSEATLTNPATGEMIDVCGGSPPGGGGDGDGDSESGGSGGDED